MLLPESRWLEQAGVLKEFNELANTNPEPAAELVAQLLALGSEVPGAGAHHGG